MSLLNTNLIYITPNNYTTHINSYKEITTNPDRPYISIEMTIDNNIIDTRLYSARVPFYMNALRSQFNLDRTITLKELLDYAMTHDFIIKSSYHPRYGLTIDPLFANQI